MPDTNVGWDFFVPEGFQTLQARRDEGDTDRVEDCFHKLEAQFTPSEFAFLEHLSLQSASTIPEVLRSLVRQERARFAEGKPIGSKTQSARYRVVTALCELLENLGHQHHFSFIDDSLTLEIANPALDSVQRARYGSQLLDEWEAVGGYVSPYDPNHQPSPTWDFSELFQEGVW